MKHGEYRLWLGRILYTKNERKHNVVEDPIVASLNHETSHQARPDLVAGIAKGSKSLLPS